MGLPAGSATPMKSTELSRRHEYLALIVDPPPVRDVADERLPAAVVEDVRAHLDRDERAVLALEVPLVLDRRSPYEQLPPRCLQPRGVVGRDDVEDRHANELVVIVSEEPAGRPV